MPCHKDFFDWFNAVAGAFEDGSESEDCQHWLTTGRRWRSLLEADVVSQGEVDAVLGIIQVNWWRTSYWEVMTEEIYAWAKESEFSMQPYDILSDCQDDLPPYPSPHETFADQECAKKFIDYFEMLNQKDPHRKLWQSAVSCVQEWLYIIESPTRTPKQSRAFFQHIERDQKIFESITVPESFHMRRYIQIWSKKWV